MYVDTAFFQLIIISTVSIVTQVTGNLLRLFINSIVLFAQALNYFATSLAKGSRRADSIVGFHQQGPTSANRAAQEASAAAAGRGGKTNSRTQPTHLRLGRNAPKVLCIG